jgi:phenylalanine-4-hydroxylase
MPKSTEYEAKQPDARGFIRYDDEENAVWRDLLVRQLPEVSRHMARPYLDGLERLALPADRVPQCPDVSRVLTEATGWQVTPVPALIPFGTFFGMLAERRFPAASFIRKRKHFDYIEEPDIFHEIFGHTPLLTNKYFADFTHTYGKLGLAASKEDRVFLARMYWFTVEFGLIQPPGKPMRIYGGGILSSIGETDYAFNSDKPQRKRFSITDALRTPYRIDIMQPLYYYLEDLRELYELTQKDLMALVADAKRMGLFAPLFPPKAEPSGVTKLASNM